MFLRYMGSTGKYRINGVKRQIGVGKMRIILKDFFRSMNLDPSRLRRWATALATSLALLGPAGAAAADVRAETGPAGFVATVGEQVVQVLAAQGAEADQRSRHFRDIFVHALDLDTMARRVLGRHWRVASTAERDRYVELFRNYVVNLYAVQLGGYAGANFTVLRQQNIRDRESLVIARIKRKYGPPLAMSFRVREANDRFRIIDVTIAGVSLIVTKRSEFDAIIRHEGLPGLLRRLDQKQASMLLHNRDVTTFIAEALSVVQSGANVLFAH
jgi:phospholipid transport system substrate-binding protein